jgi:hypothetical protein
VSLLDDIKEAHKPAGKPCAFVSIYEGLSSADRKDLRAALADKTIVGTTLAKVLTARGVNVHPSTVQYHRRGACSCGSL